MIIWVAFLAFILYSLLASCLRRNSMPHRQYPPPPDPRRRSSGWFPGGHYGDGSTPPPPPYSKHPSDQNSESWRPGFWTGAALGGLGSYFVNNRRQPSTAAPSAVPWDWERERTQRGPLFGGNRAPYTSEDRGEGSSNLGAMRRSTGLGGSNVR